jgi:hypothetical protein
MMMMMKRALFQIAIAPSSLQTMLNNNITNTVVIEDRGIRLQSDQLVTLYALSGDFPKYSMTIILHTDISFLVRIRISFYQHHYSALVIELYLQH